MSCYNPVKGYRSKEVSSTGRRAIVFKPSAGFFDLPMEVPCGKCTGCLLDRSKDWAVRCMHEASQHVDNCFITLTYSDANLPEGGSLRPRDFVLFIKRLRKYLSPATIRFFHCGEYGDDFDRPHHHCIIFGWRPPDLILWSEKRGVRLHRSAIVERLWSFGFVSVGSVTYESSAYISRYILKKVYGPSAAAHYQGRHPEYLTMSRRPGIGKKWIDKYSDDVYRSDNIVYGLGRLTKPPRYYDKQYEKLDKAHFSEIERERRIAEAGSDYNSEYRKNVRKKLQEARLDVLKRELT